VAIFAGWLTFAVGALAGLATSEFLGLAHKEGAAPPLAVYGVSAGVVLWVFIFVTFLTAFPLAYAMFADDPRRRLRVIAVAMTIGGLALVLDPLGRAFGLPLVAGAACLWAGGELIHSEAAAVAAQAPGQAAVAAPAATAYAEPHAPAEMAASPAEMAASPVETPAAAAAVAPPTEATAKSRARNGRKRAHPDAPTAVCPWCSAEVPAQAQTCPECQAVLGESDIAAFGIPGVTEVQPSLRKYMEDARAGKRRGGILHTVFGSSDSGAPVSTVSASDPSALRAPNAEIRAEMARLDAEIAEGWAGLPEVAEVPDVAEIAQPAESSAPPAP
jgi:hypothetical protein